MKIHNVTQGTLAWMQLRVGIPTASEFGNLVTPHWKVRTGEMPNTYLDIKIAEKWRGHPQHSFSGGAAEQGQILEEEAVPWYELEFKCDIDRPGFITTDDGRLGCSPDGIIGGIRGIEIKCPADHTHVGWLRNGGVPKEHRAQVWGGMHVTGLSQWTFLSYCRGFPPLLVDVHRDDIFDPDIDPFAALRDALDEFLRNFDAGWQRLVKLNGGAPARKSFAEATV